MEGEWRVNGPYSNFILLSDIGTIPCDFATCTHDQLSLVEAGFGACPCRGWARHLPMPRPGSALLGLAGGSQNGSLQSLITPLLILHWTSTSSISDVYITQLFISFSSPSRDWVHTHPCRGRVRRLPMPRLGSALNPAKAWFDRVGASRLTPGTTCLFDDFCFALLSP